MSDARYVLDASALLCILFREPGAEEVEARLSKALVSAVNVHETLSKLVDRGVGIEEARAMLDDLDIEIVPADAEQAALGGGLRAATRQSGLSLGDRSCLALAQAMQATAVTTDRAWKDIAIDTPIEVVR